MATIYVLAKKAKRGDGFDVHGVSEKEIVGDAWKAAGGVAYLLDTESAPSYVPYLPEVAEDATGDE